MLAKQKEFWKKKASDDYILAKNEAERQQVLDKNQRAWMRRADEADWLLPNVKKDTTKKLQKVNQSPSKPKGRKKKSIFDKDDGNVFDDMIADAEAIEAEEAERMAMEQAEKEKKRKKRKGLFGKLLNALTRRPASGTKPIRDVGEGEGGEGEGGSDNEGGGGESGGEAGGEEEQTSSRKNSRRVRYADLDEKEKKAKEVMITEERKKRIDFLVESASRLRILQVARVNMNVMRMPAHHKVTDHIGVGFQDYRISDKEKAKHMPKHQIPQRVEEQLRSWEEIMKDENEAMKFRVGGRHHQYLGEHRLHPLRMFPSTIEVLLPPGGTATDRMIPENNLLPNLEDKLKLQQEEEELQKKRRKAGVRVRKEQLNMSRDEGRRQQRLEEAKYQRFLRHGGSNEDYDPSGGKPPVPFVTLSGGNSARIHPSTAGSKTREGIAMMSMSANTSPNGKKKNKKGNGVFDEYGLAETEISLPSFPSEQKYFVIENERERMMRDAQRRTRDLQTR